MSTSLTLPRATLILLFLNLKGFTNYCYLSRLLENEAKWNNYFSSKMYYG